MINNRTQDSFIFSDETFVGVQPANVIGHEIGHNFGLRHDDDAGAGNAPGLMAALEYESLTESCFSAQNWSEVDIDILS